MAEIPDAFYADVAAGMGVLKRNADGSVEHIPLEQVYKTPIPVDIMKVAEATLDKLLCNDTESCGGTEALHKAAATDIALAILAERLSRNEGFRIAISYLEETLGFASLSQGARENVETALHLLTVEG